MRLTAVIVDDHAGFRSIARQLLEDAGFEVVGEAADGRSAVAVVATLRPRLVLLDVQLPEVDGFAVADDLARTAPDAVVVLTSVRSVAEYPERRVAAAPIRAFVPKAELSGARLAQLVADRA